MLDADIRKSSSIRKRVFEPTKISTHLRYIKMGNAVLFFRQGNLDKWHNQLNFTNISLN